MTCIRGRDFRTAFCADSALIQHCREPIATSSTSKVRSAFFGIFFAPSGPYAMYDGMWMRRCPPSRMLLTPTSSPRITFGGLQPNLNAKGLDAGQQRGEGLTMSHGGSSGCNAGSLARLRVLRGRERTVCGVRQRIGRFSHVGDGGCWGRRDTR